MRYKSRFNSDEHGPDAVDSEATSTFHMDGSMRLGKISDNHSGADARYIAAKRGSDSGRVASPGRSSTAYERLSQSNQGCGQILGVA